MLRILVMGATSAIAEATARLYAEEGAVLFLAGRDMEHLNVIAADLLVRGALQVQVRRFDASETGGYQALLDDAWMTLGCVDVALIAHGSLPKQEECETSMEMALGEFFVNGTSVIALSIALAQRLCRGSTLAVISSVAGDRGRASNYLYGSAKAAVSTFLSGLGQRLLAEGVNVLLIKPGFVETPMTRDFTKGALWVKPEKVARGIVRAIRKRKSMAYLPGYWWCVMSIINVIPEGLFRRMKL